MPNVQYIKFGVHCCSAGSYYANADQNALRAGVQAEQRQLRKAKPELEPNGKRPKHGALSHGSRLAATCFASYSTLAYRIADKLQSTLL